MSFAGLSSLSRGHSKKVTMPRQQFGFQPDRGALNNPFYIFLMMSMCNYTLEFYNRWLLQIFPSLLSVTVAHYAIVVLLATFLQLLWVTQRTDKRRSFPDWCHYLKNELPMVIVRALDIVCSIWNLVYMTLLSLNTMTTSTSMIFILMFAIAFGLERWSDISQPFVGIAPLFTSRLLLYTFMSTESNVEEFVLAVFVIGLSGLRWTIVQILAQKHESAEQALEQIQQLKDGSDRVKREKCQGERERLDLLAQKKNVEKERRDIRQRNLELVVQNNSLQRDIRATEALAHELKIKHARLKVQKHRLEKEKNDLQNDQLVVEDNSLLTLLIAKEKELRDRESFTTAQQEEMRQLESLKNRLLLELCQREERGFDVPKHELIQLERTAGGGGIFVRHIKEY